MSSIIWGIILGIAIVIAVIVVLLMIGKKNRKNRLSYTEYLDRYGDLGPYDSSDIDKYT